MKYNSLPFIPYGRSSFVPILLLLFVMNFSSVISDYVRHTCDNPSTSSDGSTYSKNLNLVIKDLFHNAPKSSGFNTSSRGQSPYKVYGLLQCIGNISPQKCSNCVLEANKTIQNVCANNISGLIWFEECFMRYDSSNFISILDASGENYVSLYDISSKSEAFESTVTRLLSNLSNEAYIPANKGFAAGLAISDIAGYIYGLVQCWEDISIPDCITCLVKGIAQMENISPTKLGARVLYGSCMIRYEVYQFFESSQEPTPSPEGFHPASTPFLPPKAAFSPSKLNGISLTRSKKKFSKALLMVLGLVGSIILVLIICLIVSRKIIKSGSFWMLVTPATHNQEMHGFSLETGLFRQEQHFVFSLDVLVEATENFHDNKKIGEGGFGAVYKGTTTDGNDIAVKKLSAKSKQGKNEFMNEVKLMTNVQHRNLAKLLGCCVEGNERLLVYEYFPNKSLDTYLYDSDKCGELDWHKRYNIITGIARGLLYLHQDSQLRVIHRDIKISNILLDRKLNAKIADFGLARLFPEDETHINTRVAGTFGYIAPEYAIQGQLSVKVDVYSFGVVLLEIITGRKNGDIHLPYEMQNLLEWVWKLFKGGNAMNMVDSKASKVVEEQALRCIHVGLLCVQADATLRPTMSNVIMMISSSSEKLSNPSKPAFVSNSESHASNSKSMSSTRIEENGKGTTSQICGKAMSSSSEIQSVNEVSDREIESS
ncbi:hypothetical protein SUGI_0357280 [Cryptomeria japonica]|nr:hypothetical protein SUGI_0357280 [Cryptomeria japonica]